MKQANYTIKRLYCKPTMKVIELKQKCRLLTLSGQGVNNPRSGAAMNVVYEEEDI